MRAYLFSIIPAIAFKFGFLVMSAVASFSVILCGGSRIVLHAENFYRGWAVVAQDHIAQELGYVKPVGEVQAALTRDEIIEREARFQKINPDLIRAIIHVESRGKKYAESHVGATGLMQVMPEWTSKLGLEHESQLYDEETNIKAGTWILASNLKTYKGDVIAALECYNGGPKMVGHPKTREYARAVLEAFALKKSA